MTLGPAHCWLARDLAHGSIGVRWGGCGVAGLGSRSSFSLSTNLHIFQVDVTHKYDICKRLLKTGMSHVDTMLVNSN